MLKPFNGVVPITAVELQRWRRQLQWTQERAAAWLKVTEGSYRNWEQGRRKALHPGTLRSRMEQAKRRAGQ